MLKKMPTYSICNLLGANRCSAEIVVMGLRHFIDNHANIQFPHRHNFYQIVLFTHGGGQHSIDFHQFNIEPRQVYYMMPGQIHTWDFDHQTDGILINFNESLFTSICHNPNFIREFPIFSTLEGRPVNNLDAKTFKTIETSMRLIQEEFESDQEFKLDAIRGLLLTVLIHLSRATPRTVREGISKHSDTLMRQFEFLIEQHFREKRLPKDYAELMFITPNYLNTLTNNAIGKSAGEIIRDRILLEAKRLLGNSDLMIGQIAAMLHFEDNAYFTRFFKKYTGLTPEGFRATYMISPTIAPAPSFLVERIN